MAVAMAILILIIADKIGINLHFTLLYMGNANLGLIVNPLLFFVLDLQRRLIYSDLAPI